MIVDEKKNAVKPVSEPNPVASQGFKAPDKKDDSKPNFAPKTDLNTVVGDTKANAPAPEVKKV